METVGGRGRARMSALQRHGGLPLQRVFSSGRGGDRPLNNRDK